MNRKDRTRSSSKRTDESFLRYLKPGALAQLRDSRINARSNRLDLKFQISSIRIQSPLLSPIRSPNRLAEINDGFLHFSGKIYGPRCQQRKRLLASRSVFFINSSPASPVADSPDSVIDAFSNDILVSH
ncbi:uncharacterized protein LOC124910264 [Impatiens glandulifera]|uniref:uncharacterized protein LOC124910264 n=1 Tax=Impatiens glandulifera TaxID=253017 RepID=UPI001FB0ABC6|nr:uncharacterized protein LOC124910264 [Impatiens glandulifera]